MKILFKFNRLDIIISLILLSVSIILISCTHEECMGLENTCDQLTNCDDNLDCHESQYCRDGACRINECLNQDYNVCGKGECIPGDDLSTENVKENYHCECYENSVHLGLCIPTCSGFSQECIDFDNSFTGNGAYDDCNIELGHCDASCQGEGSCEEGFYCSVGGTCRISSN